MPDSLPTPDHRDLRIDYVELPVTDMAEAQRFYGSVFGWSFTDYGPAYASFNDGRLDGGLSVVPSVTRGGPLVIFYAADLDAVEETVKAAGGQISEHIDFPGGRRFHFLDPSGNELAVWSDR